MFLFYEREELYYEMLYTVSDELLNADRDYYQAMLAATQYYNMANGLTDLPPEMLETKKPEKLEEYYTNYNQVLEHIDAAIEKAQLNPDLYTGTTLEGDTTTFREYADTFRTELQDWYDSYDMETLTGDWTTYNNDFTITRETLSDLGDITEQWAITEKNARIMSLHHTFTTFPSSMTG